MAGMSVPERCLTALHHAGKASTGEIAKAVCEPSGIIAARMLGLEDAGKVRRIDGGAGRGSVARWEIVR